MRARAVCVCVRVWVSARLCVRVCSSVLVCGFADTLACARSCSLIQHAKRVRAILWRHLWPLWLHRIFRYYLINGTIFRRKKVIEYKTCVLIFSTNLSKKFLILRRIRRDIIIHVKSLHVKYPLLLSDFYETRIFSTYFRRKHEVSNFIEILLVEAELFHADERTEMTKLRVAFRNAANAPKKYCSISRFFNILHTTYFGLL